VAIPVFFGFDCGCFLSLVDTNAVLIKGVTNAVLVDKNNRAPKLTNTVLSLLKLATEGEVGNIRLGMTMDEIVTRWGKPIWLHPNCDGGHLLNFTDCSLVFRGNSLSKVRFQETALFDQGLSAQSNLQQWRQVFGEPTLLNTHPHGNWAVSCRKRTPCSLTKKLAFSGIRRERVCDRQ
jgi:hypothetical protein